jgi:hypothetical protein
LKSKVSQWGSLKVAESTLENFFGGHLKSYEDEHQIKNQADDKESQEALR